MPTSFADNWLRTTVLVTQPLVGTGFIVTRPEKSNPKRGQLFLVTNKHVLGDGRLGGQTITLHLNVRAANAVVDQEVNYVYTPPLIRDHSIRDVDICALEITSLMNEIPHHHTLGIPYSVFALRDQVQRINISPGDEILTVGYPLGFKQGNTNFPIVRQGVLATSLLEDLSGAAIAPRKGQLPAFLVDGGTIPGSSGSPVILKPVSGRQVGENIELGPAPAILLGIIAETRFAPIGNTLAFGFAGLGMAFRVEAIREVIEQFPTL